MLNRARIDGSFYHGLGFIWQEVVSDTKIEGTWHQSGTVVLDEVQFRGLTLSGDLDASDSAFGHFSIDASQVRGGVILNDSEARCGYDIRTMMDEQDKDRLKRWLILVRVIGVVWGVFLLAALNALIKH